MHMMQERIFGRNFSLRLFSVFFLNIFETVALSSLGQPRLSSVVAAIARDCSKLPPAPGDGEYCLCGGCLGLGCRSGCHSRWWGVLSSLHLDTRFLVFLRRGRGRLLLGGIETIDYNLADSIFENTNEL